MTDGLSIVLLGRFELRSDATLIDHRWARGKAKALLKVLALAQGRALHCEQIMELLWPGLASAVAANQLRENLHYLRAELDRHGVTSPVARRALPGGWPARPAVKLLRSVLRAR